MRASADRSRPAATEREPRRDSPREHLRRLMAWWSLLADLSFSDLLLFVPGSVASVDDLPDDTDVPEPSGGTAPTGRSSRSGSAADDNGRTGRTPRPWRRLGPDAPLTVIGQVRPTTGRTLYRDDHIGLNVAASERPLVSEAFARGVIVTGEGLRVPGDRRARITAVPVTFDGVTIAVMSSEVTPRFTDIRDPGELERTYIATFGRLARMVAAGSFPYRGADITDEEAPRVGDGLFLTDETTRIGFATPNAVSALHRIGVGGNVQGRRVRDLDLGPDVVGRAMSGGIPVVDEVEHQSVTVQLQALPLTDAPVRNALVLLRDVTELRRRDRLLISKDATIREIHHRVTNNLQTVSSLLRIQARRLESREANRALDEAVRRIRAIALVHQTLSTETTDDVDFCDVAETLTETMRQSITFPERPIDFSVSCEAGMLRSQTATSLAVVLNELLQNAVDHAFPQLWELDDEALEAPGLDESPIGRVEVEIRRPSPDVLSMAVRDDGVGIPADYDAQRSGGLGTSIVRALCGADLGGTFEVRRRTPLPGSEAEVQIPLRTSA